MLLVERAVFLGLGDRGLITTNPWDPRAWPDGLPHVGLHAFGVTESFARFTAALHRGETPPVTRAIVRETDCLADTARLTAVLVDGLTAQIDTLEAQAARYADYWETLTHYYPTEEK